MKTTLRISGFILLLSGTMFLFAGCATKQAYEGPKLPPESVAIIKPSNPGVIDLAVILQVDGKKRGFFEEIAEVLPGEHTVLIQVSSGFPPVTIYRTKALPFNAKAGHVYRVEGKVRGGRAIAWIEDETTNEVVAGEKQ